MWSIEEALTFYKGQGAPGDQAALVSFLKEVHRENGGSIPEWSLSRAAQFFQINESFLRAVIRRIPGLRVENTHCLEICCGQNCSRRAQLVRFVEKTYGTKPEGFEVKYVNCMRMCGKGPNIRWDGEVYYGADEKLVSRLLSQGS